MNETMQVKSAQRDLCLLLAANSRAPGRAFNAPSNNRGQRDKTTEDLSFSFFEMRIDSRPEEKHVLLLRILRTLAYSSFSSSPASIRRAANLAYIALTELSHDCLRAMGSNTFVTKLMPSTLAIRSLQPSESMISKYSRA